MRSTGSESEAFFATGVDGFGFRGDLRGDLRRSTGGLAGGVVSASVVVSFVHCLRGVVAALFFIPSFVDRCLSRLISPANCSCIAL